MNNAEFLADQLRRAHQGEAWHGPSLREALSGVTAEMASARPVAKAHTIWELVRHIGAWVHAAGKDLEGAALAAAEDWPAVGEPNQPAWQATLGALDQETERLQNAISKMPEEDLKKGVTGRDFSIRFMLEGVIQHHLYHAGQIALLKKMVSKPN